MYGLVNKAVQGLVVSNFGEETWLQIKEKAGVTEREFTPMESYDDAITYSLVGAACEVLELSAKDVLNAFGKYWVHEIGAKYYAPLMDRAGDDLTTFLTNLDHLHSRVQVSFPKLSPPSFSVKTNDDGSLTLLYFSKRPGLEEMVVGLIHGLGERFGSKVTIEQTKTKEEAGHAEFHIIETR
jgi:hypothetical protein